MKRITTLLKQFIDLENEIKNNYTDKEIQKGFQKIEKQGIHISVTSLAYQLWEGVEQNIYLDEEFPDN